MDRLGTGMDRRGLLVGTAIAGALTGLSAAQGLQAVDAAAPPPLPITRVRLDAAVSVSASGSDNIFATANARIGDTIVLTRPSLSASLTGLRHRTQFALTADIARFQDNPGENYDDLTASLGSGLIEATR
jgi:hypothetical protein